MKTVTSGYWLRHILITGRLNNIRDYAPPKNKWFIDYSRKVVRNAICLGAHKYKEIHKNYSMSNTAPYVYFSQFFNH